jgi:hypothetical protein
MNQPGTVRQNNNILDMLTCQPQFVVVPVQRLAATVREVNSRITGGSEVMALDDHSAVGQPIESYVRAKANTASLVMPYIS